METPAPARATTDSPLDELVGYQLRRLSLLTMTDLAAALGPLDLRPTEVSILLVIEAEPGTTQSAVGRKLGVQRANMAPLIAGLEARGIISKMRNDGRSHALHLTEDGKALARRAFEAARDSDGRCLRLSEALRRDLALQLRALWRTIEGRDGPSD